jgi:hypothetical protein
MNTYGSADSFGISEISSRLASPSDSDIGTSNGTGSIHDISSVPSDDPMANGNNSIPGSGANNANAVKIIPTRKLSKKGTMEASFMMSENDFHLGNSFLPRVNSLEPYNMSLKKAGSERTLSRTRDFMLVPADIVLIPSKDKKGGVEKSIAYKGIDNALKSGESSLASLRRAKREKAMQRSKQIITKMVSGSDYDDGCDMLSSERPLAPTDSNMSVSAL